MLLLFTKTPRKKNRKRSIRYKAKLKKKNQKRKLRMYGRKW